MWAYTAPCASNFLQPLPFPSSSPSPSPLRSRRGPVLASIVIDNEGVQHLHGDYLLASNLAKSSAAAYLSESLQVLDKPRDGKKGTGCICVTPTPSPSSSPYETLRDLGFFLVDDKDVRRRDDRLQALRKRCKASASLEKHLQASPPSPASAKAAVPRTWSSIVSPQLYWLFPLVLFLCSYFTLFCFTNKQTQSSGRTDGVLSVSQLAREKLAAVKQRIADLESSNTQCLAANNDWEQLSERLQAKITHLQRTNVECKEHYASLQARNDQLEQRISTLQHHLEAQHDQLLHHETALQPHITDLHERLESIDLHNTHLQSHTADLQLHIHDLTQRNTAIERENINWRTTLHALEDSHAATRAQLTERSGLVASLREQLAAKEFELQNVLTVSQARIRELGGQKVRLEGLVGEVGWLRYVVGEVGRVALWESEGFEGEELVMVEEESESLDGVEDLEAARWGNEGEHDEGDFDDVVEEAFEEVVLHDGEAW